MLFRSRRRWLPWSKLPPEGQIVLAVDTDAVVPAAPGATPEPAYPGPVFDRLSVDFFAPGEDSPCPDCAREFPVDDRMFAERRVSVGFVPSG